MVRIKAKVRIDMRKLKLIPKLVERGIIEGLKKGSVEVARKAIRFAPRKTGDLKRSIKPDFNVKKGPNSFSINIGSPLNYAAKMERPGRVIREGRRPYLAPALKQSIRKIIFHLKTEIRRSVK